MISHVTTGQACAQACHKYKQTTDSRVNGATIIKVGYTFPYKRRKHVAGRLKGNLEFVT